LRDLEAITGWSRPTILAEVECGRLIAFRLRERRGSPWCFERHVVRAWWARIRAGERA
jgi:hypothetical protein